MDAAEDNEAHAQAPADAEREAAPSSTTGQERLARIGLYVFVGALFGSITVIGIVREFIDWSITSALTLVFCTAPAWLMAWLWPPRARARS